MRPVIQAFASPLKGVSQQNPRDRVDGQCTEQVNLIADPVRMLTKRAPVEYINKLREHDENVSDEFLSYNNKEYSVSTGDNYLSVFCITDNKLLSSTEPVPPYITSNMKIASSANEVLLVNTRMETAMSSDIDVAQDKQFIVMVLGGVADTTYGIQIKIDGKTYEKLYKVDSTALATADNVTTKLFEAFNNDTGFKGYFDLQMKYDCIYFNLKDKTQTYSVAATDGYSLNNLVLAEVSVSEAARLPTYAPNNYTLKVAKVPEDSVSSYYMKYVIRDKEDGSDKVFGDIGDWVETAQAGIVNKFDTSTMPHTLVIEGDTFYAKEAEWKPRRAGDEESSPVPSFIGKTINDIAVVQGRVNLVSQSSFMTRTNEPLDCWRNSATVLVDSDPIDIENTVAIGNKITNIVQYNKNIAYYADDVQFVTDVSYAINPANVAMPIASTFSYDGVKPVSTGTSVIHSYKKGNYTALLEIFPSTDTEETPFQLITEQVERYIPGECRQIISNLAFNTAMVLCTGEVSSAYVYKYLMSGNQKVLSAWSKYEFPFEVLRLFSYSDKVYVVYKNNNDVFIGVMNLDYPEDTDGLGFTVHLDNKLILEVVDGIINAPFDITEQYKCVFLADSNGNISGLPEDIDAINRSSVKLKSPLTGKVALGIPMHFSYMPNQPFMKDANGNVINGGSINITKFVGAFENTASFNVGIVNTITGKEESYSASANLANNTINKYSKINLLNGTLTLPFCRESERYNIRLYGDDYTPFTLVDLSFVYKWFSTYRSR